jgi:phosphate transport system protein
MVDDAITAYEADDPSRIQDFSSGRCPPALDLPGRDNLHDGRPEKYLALYALHMVARYLERCADHACKIAENVHYMETGERTEIK